jgi:hypothetical protein
MLTAPQKTKNAASSIQARIGFHGNLDINCTPFLIAVATPSRRACKVSLILRWKLTQPRTSLFDSA